MNKILNLYKKLLKKHGPQGWWPIMGKYHPNDFSTPKNANECFEICIGAILTQNTSWKNVEKALDNLSTKNLLNPKMLLSIPEKSLAVIIKPTGYFNQKAKKIKIFSDFFLSLKDKSPAREQLLNIWGIGPETADSILLYAYKQPIFIVDAYTRRILSDEKLVIENAGYQEIQQLFHDSIPRDYQLFNEFHALIVQEGKNRTARNINPRKNKNR